MKKLRRFIFVFALLAGLLVGAGGYWLSSYAVNSLQAALRSNGLPEAVVRWQDEGRLARLFAIWAGLPQVEVFAKPDDRAALVKVTVNVWVSVSSSFFSRIPSLHLSSLEADCATLPETKSTGAVQLPLAPLPLPAVMDFSLSAQHVSLSCRDIGYVANFLLVSKSGATNGALMVATKGDLSALGRTGPVVLSGQWAQDGTFSSQAEMGQEQTPLPDWPWVKFSQKFVDGQLQASADFSLPKLTVGGQTVEQLRLKINPEQKTGTRLPLQASVTFTGQELKFAGTLDVAKQSLSGEITGGLKLPVAEAVGLKAGVQVPALQKPELTARPFSITALQLGGLPLTAISGKLGYKGGKAQLSDVRALLFGGQLKLSPFTVSVPPDKISTTATFTDLDLGQIIQLGAVDGLTGTGRISGTVPLAYHAGKLTLASSELKATSTGSIIYNPAQMPGFMGSGGQGAILGQIFNDFRYDGLSLNVGGALGGGSSDTLTLGVRLAGSNPSFYNGHPVVFNLNLSGALESLLTQGLASFRFSPEDLARMVKEGEKP